MVYHTNNFPSIENTTKKQRKLLLRKYKLIDDSYHVLHYYLQIYSVPSGQIFGKYSPRRTQLSRGFHTNFIVCNHVQKFFLHAQFKIVMNTFCMNHFKIGIRCRIDLQIMLVTHYGKVKSRNFLDYKRFGDFGTFYISRGKRFRDQ